VSESVTRNKSQAHDMTITITVTSFSGMSLVMFRLELLPQCSG
jgi:hypothetical protein